ncbi:hypothetical protein [Spirosoma gilvum]
MKRLRLLMFILSVSTLLTGCHPDGVPAGLVGDWLWQGTTGGIAGGGYKAKPGEKVTLHLSTDNHFALYRNDSLLISGAFQIKQTKSIYSGKDGPDLEPVGPIVSNLNGTNSVPVAFWGIISVTAMNTLTISENAADGFTSQFIRR